MEILLSQSMEYRKRQKYAAVQIVKKLFLLSLMVKGEPNAKNPLLNFLYVLTPWKICIKNRFFCKYRRNQGVCISHVPPDSHFRAY